MGIDYPKVHDVGRIFAERVREKLSGFDEGKLREIERIAMWLGEARAPSFSFERDYTAGDAQKAYEDARFVFEEVKKILDRIL